MTFNVHSHRIHKGRKFTKKVGNNSCQPTTRVFNHFVSNVFSNFVSIVSSFFIFIFRGA